MKNNIPKTVVANCKGGEKIQVPVKDLFFRPSVYGIVIEGDTVLLSRQWGDGWDFPGGGMDIHETIHEALKREVWEETGIEVDPIEIITCEHQFHKTALPPHETMNWIGMYFLCKKIGGSLSLENIDTDESRYIDKPEWIPIHLVDTLTFYNGAKSSADLIRKAKKMYESRN